MKDNVFLRIAEFNIQFKFDKSKEKRKREIYIKMFKQHVRHFLTKPSAKPDLTVTLKDRPKTKRPNTTLLIKNRTAKKILSYYQDEVKVDIIIQNALYILLSDNNGFIIHSSAVNIKNKSVLFFGKSGAGKSTIVNLLSNKFPVLSDDISLVRNLNGRYFHFQHPLMEKNYYPKTKKGFEISTIYVLTKSTKDKIIPINHEKTLPKFISQLNVIDNKITKTAIDFYFGLNTINRVYFTKNHKNVINLFTRNEAIQNKKGFNKQENK